MKKRLLILIALIFLITGCSTEYNVVIDDNYIKEEIVTTINDEDIPTQTEEEKADEIELDDEITPFIKEDQYPFDDEHDKYEKKVYRKDGETIVKLTYNYLYDEYTRSKAYSCFDNHKISNVDGALDIEFSGGFYCLMGDSVTINLFTDKTVTETNADKVNGNKYTWLITDENADNASIVLKTKSNVKTNNIMVFLISFLAVFLVIAVVLYLNSNKKKK